MRTTVGAASVGARDAAAVRASGAAEGGSSADAAVVPILCGCTAGGQEPSAGQAKMPGQLDMPALRNGSSIESGFSLATSPRTVQ